MVVDYEIDCGILKEKKKKILSDMYTMECDVKDEDFQIRKY